MQWVEWDSDAFSNYMGLPVSSAEPAWLGNYSAQDWPNPIKTHVVDLYTGVVQASERMPLASNDPSEFLSGSLGYMKYQPVVAGSHYESTGTTNFDTGIMMELYDEYNAEKTTYLNTMKSYNIAREEYNKALKDEGLRRMDPFKVMNTKVTVIPPRPCGPTPMADYSGPSLDLDLIWAN
jgi:hypothetical protein